MGVRVDWVPGHSGSIGNGAAHSAASELLFSRSSPLGPVPLTPVRLDPEEERERLKVQAKRELKAKVPHNAHPLPKGLPRGAQVLVHKARTGAALTEDVLAKWRAYAASRKTRGHQRQRLDNEEEEETEAKVMSSSVTCSTCDIGARPTIRHLLWDCPGLAAVRDKHKGRGITSLEAWTTPPPQADARRTINSLWEFVREAGLTGRL